MDSKAMSVFDRELVLDEKSSCVGTGECGPQKQSHAFSFSESPNFESIRKMQERFVEERNWHQFHKPTNLLLAMIKEVGEVSELFQWKDKVEEGLPDWSEKEKIHLAHELSDVYIYLQSLAEKCKIDLPKVIMEKMKQNALKYPANKVWGSSKKYTEYQ